MNKSIEIKYISLILINRITFDKAQKICWEKKISDPYWYIFWISLCWIYWSVCMYVCMSRRNFIVLFICISGTILWYTARYSRKLDRTFSKFACHHFVAKKSCPQNLKKIGVVRDFECTFSDMWNVPWIEICYNSSIFWNLTKLYMNVNIGYDVILPCHKFHLRSQWG